MDLGNLYFSLNIKDEVSGQIDGLRKKLGEKLVVEPKITITQAAIDDAMSKIKKTSTFNIPVLPKFNESALRGQIDAISSGNPILLKAIVSINKNGLRNQIATLQKSLPPLQLQITSAGMGNLVSLVNKLTKAMEDFKASVSGVNDGINKVTGGMSRQSDVITQLNRGVRTYFSLFTINRVLRSLIEIGGAFETQRIALRAIIGDAQKAEDIFARIKGLAIESPFSFRDLASYTKQLTAFQIPYNELYDTTKRLADISAGLGVSMDRLILAYGQVRSAAFLRGQEVRQFSEAGIPLIGELARKFSELEGRVVSAGEVFERISQRMVSFQMVKDVLFEMTDEGGKFFNMQAVLMESLSGRMMKFKDSWEIMLSEIAEGNSGALKGGINLLIDMLDHWEAILTVLKSVVGVYLTVTGVAAAFNKIMGVGVPLMKLYQGVTAALTASKLSLIKITRQLTQAELDQFTASKALAKSISPSAFGAVAAIIVGIITLFKAWHDETTKIRREIEALTGKAVASASNLVSEYKHLVDKLGELREGTHGYAEIIKQLNRQYGDYLPQIFAQAEAYDTVKNSIEGVTKAIYAKIEADTYDSGRKVVEDKFKESISEGTVALRESVISRLSGISRSEASEIVGAINRKIREAVESGDAIDLAYFRNIVNEIDDRFSEFKPSKAKGLAYDPLYSTFQSARKIIDAYKDQAKEVENLNDQMKMLSVVGYAPKIKAELEAIDAVFAQKRSDSDLGTSDKEIQLERLQSRLEVFQKAGLLQGIKDTEAEIAALNKVTDEWIANAIRLAGEGMEIGGQMRFAANLRPDDETIKDQAAYFRKLFDYYEELKEKIADFEKLGDSASEASLVELETLKYQKSKVDEFDKLSGEILHLFDKKAKPATGTTSKIKDPIAERAQAQIDLWRDAMAMYEKYSSELGREDAIKAVRKNELFAGMDFRPDDYKAILKLTADALGDSDEQKKVKEKILSMLTDIDLVEIKLTAGEVMNVFEQEMTERAKEWDVFGKIFQATGDRETAFNLAFTNNTDAKSYIEEFARELKRVSKDQFGIELTFDETSVDLIRRQIGAVYEGLPDALKKQIDALDKLRLEERSKTIGSLADLLKSETDFEQERMAIREKYAKAIEMTDGETQKRLIRNRQEELSDVDVRELKQDSVFKKLLGDLSVYSEDVLKEMITKAEKIIMTSKNLSIKGMNDLLNIVRNATTALNEKNPFKVMADSYALFKHAVAHGDAELMSTSLRTFKSAEKAVENMNSMMSNLASNSAELGSVFSRDFGEKLNTLAKAAGLLSDAFHKLSTSETDSTKKLQGITSLIGAITLVAGALAEAFDLSGQRAAENRKWQEEQLQLQKEYKSILLSLKDEDYESIFGTDVLRKSADAYKIMTDALVSYQEHFRAATDEEKAYLEHQGTLKGGPIRDYKGDINQLMAYRLDLMPQEEIAALKRGRIGGVVTPQASLYDIAPEIFNEDGTLNIDIARAWVNSAANETILAWNVGLRTEIEDAIMSTEKYNDALEAVKGDLMDTFGGLAQGAIDGVIDSIRNGTDMWDAFRESGVTALETLGEKMIYNMFLAEKFDRLQEDLLKTYDNYTDPEAIAYEQARVMDEFFGGIGETLLNSQDFARRWKEMAAEYGFDVWKPDATDKSREGLIASVQGLTEETGGLLVSYISAVRADVSVLRMLAERNSDALPQISNTIALMQMELSRIQFNTLRNADMAEEIRDILVGATLGTRKIYVA